MSKTETTTVLARIIEAGDLEYKIRTDTGTFSGEGEWQHREYPRSMLIQFAMEDDLIRALEEGLVAVEFKFEATGEPIP